MGSSSPLLLDRPGHSELLLGNEAIVRGAIEAGVGFACGYPGTPSTEVTDAFARLAPALGIPFEYSVNEKIALEMAFAASIAGARSIVAMKHLGLMYAGDPLSTIPYIGTVGGMVIVSAGDPSCFTSPNEQDQRHLADMLHIPLFDPRTPQEALDITRFAFALSERCSLPVILRPTTRVCHTMAAVRFGPIEARREPSFHRAPERFIPIPATARRLRGEITTRLAVARKMIDESGLFLPGNPSAGHRHGIAILASGSPAATCADLLVELGIADEVTLLATGVISPLPETRLVAHLRNVRTLLVIEELSPYLEDHVRALISLHDLKTEVLGKRSGHLPENNEYGPEVIQGAIYEAFRLGKPPVAPPNPEATAPRPPTLCPSCPHRSAFVAARSVFGEDALFFNDIGCYTLGAAPPLKAGDALLCMGAGFTLAAGVARTTGERTLGFVGDSTFFHSGMPALLNAIKSDVNMVAVIMDNEVTAMTGFQQSPAIEIEGGRVRRTVNIEGVVRGLGAKHVETVDPHDLQTTFQAFERARDHQGLSVIITTHACPVYHAKLHLGDAQTGSAAEVDTYRVEPSTCGRCGRAATGHRCEQGVSESFERAIVRARALEVDPEVARPDVAPCAERCPLYLCIQGYTAHIVAGHYREALELILAGLPLPDAVCRVCHKPCESACVRGGVDEAVGINDLKRFVMDWANAQDEFPYQIVPAPDNGLRVAVVGMGPAGLAAAHDLRARGYEVHGFDAAPAPGGLLRSGIPAYRLPREALARDVERILAAGVHFEGGMRLGDNLHLADLLARHDVVLLAIGAGRGVALALPGDGPAVVDALAYLRRPTVGAKSVVVIGGGNAAIDASRTALRQGAERVVIACLEGRDEMPAIGEEIHEAAREGVELHAGRRARRRVAGGVELVDVASRVAGDFSRANFDDVAGSQEVIPADLVITAIGQQLDEAILAGLEVGLACEDGLVRIDRDTGCTSHPRLFAAGDLVTRDRTVTGAIASGLRAAWGIDRVLRGGAEADRRLPPPHVAPGVPWVAGPEKKWRTGYEPRHRPPVVDPNRGVASFAEVVGSLDEARARAEAARCLFCGRCGNCRSCLDLFGCPAFLLDDESILINAELCVACGVCAGFCPNGALVPVAHVETVASGEGGAR